MWGQNVMPFPSAEMPMPYDFDERRLSAALSGEQFADS
jgi:hypothetical protein